MSIGVYKKRLGAQVRFSDLQRLALMRAGQWSPHEHVHIGNDSGIPTYSNAEIADQIRTYEKLTHVGVLHPVYSHPSRPFYIRNPKRYGEDATAASFLDAMECASQEFQCDIVTVTQRDFQQGFTELAARWEILLLVIL